MGKMQVKDLVPGMITTEPVKTQRGQLIINEGVPLTRQLIARMEFYGIAEASVVVVQTEPTEPVKAAPPSASPVPPAEKLAVLAPELTYSQKIRKSFSFQKFQVDYTNHVHKFYDYLKDFKETGTLHYADELVAIPKTLMQETRTSIQFFDMLHNLRQIDDSVYAHSLNVAMISRMLGRWLKLPSEELDTLTLAGALHDVGKFLIPEEVLNKEGKLTDEEFALIKSHPLKGHDLLKKQQLNYHIKQAALMHHERCDGSGYPLGLTRDETDSYAMIIAIADVYDAMTAARKYRAPLCPFQVIAEFEKDGFSKYHPKYILTFLERIANSYQSNRVLLNDGRSATIIFLNQKHLSKPMVKLDDGTCIDLSCQPSLFIKAVL